MIELEVCKSYAELENILGKKQCLNVFYAESFLKDTGGKYYYLYSKDFVIPVTIHNKAFFKNATLPTEPCRYADFGETEDDFLNSVADYIKLNDKVHWIMETPASALFNTAPDKAISIPFGSHIIDLSNDVEVLWSNVHSKHRNVIKKAEKEGVEIVKGISEKILEDYNKINIETWARSNVKTDGVSHLRKMVSKMGENIIFYMAYKDGEPQAGAIFFYNKAMSYYMHGASSDHPFTGSSNLLHWHAIQDMKEAGVKRYSFVGARINEDPDSKYHGIQRFKERFGGELVVGKRFKVILNPFMYKCFVLLHSFKASIKNHRWELYKDSIDMELPKWKEQ